MVSFIHTNRTSQHLLPFMVLPEDNFYVHYLYEIIIQSWHLKYYMFSYADQSTIVWAAPFNKCLKLFYASDADKMHPNKFRLGMFCICSAFPLDFVILLHADSISNENVLVIWTFCRTIFWLGWLTVAHKYPFLQNI